METDGAGKGDLGYGAIVVRMDWWGACKMNVCFRMFFGTYIFPLFCKLNTRQKWPMIPTIPIPIAKAKAIQDQFTKKLHYLPFYRPHPRTCISVHDTFYFLTRCFMIIVSNIAPVAYIHEYPPRTPPSHAPLIPFFLPPFFAGLLSFSLRSSLACLLLLSFFHCSHTGCLPNNVRWTILLNASPPPADNTPDCLLRRTIHMNPSSGGPCP